MTVVLAESRRSSTPDQIFLHSWNLFSKDKHDSDVDRYRLVLQPHTARFLLTLGAYILTGATPYVISKCGKWSRDP